MKNKENEMLLNIARGGGQNAENAREKLIESNLKLVHLIVRKFTKDVNSDKYQDYYQTGCEGLIKGVDRLIEKGLDTSRANFSGFISACVKNEILMLMHREYKYTTCLSLNTKINNSDFSEEFIDNLVDDKSEPFEEKILESKLILKIKECLQLLPEKQAKALKEVYFSSCETISEASKNLKHTPSYVSRLVSEAIKNVKKLCDIEVYENISKDDKFEDESYLQSVKSILQYLSPFQQHLITLLYLDKNKRSMNEVAQILNKNVRDLPSLVLTARKRVKKLLDKGVTLRDRLYSGESVEEIRDFLHLLHPAQAEVFNLLYLTNPRLTEEEAAMHCHKTKNLIIHYKNNSIDIIEKAMQKQNQENQ